MTSSSPRTLVVVTGPTASGKSELAVALAKALPGQPHILGADSRQMFRDISIGTAAPSPDEMGGVPHHFVGTLALTDYYSAARYESEALALLEQLWSREDSSPLQIVCGGSMMYIDALTRGIDEMPEITPATREYVRRLHDQYGLDGVMAQLRILDPAYAAEVDPSNTRRVMHALELCLQSGLPCSALRTGAVKQRPFRIITFVPSYSREELFRRIGLRVEKMIEAGLVDEARTAFQRYGTSLNSLNTVGYRELLPFFRGECDLEAAKAKIARNTRVYAKKQLTWLKSKPQENIHYITPGPQALELCLSILNKL